MNNPLIEILMAGIGALLLIVIVKGGATLVYFFRDMIAISEQGDSQPFEKLGKIILGFRLRSMAQRLALVTFIMSGFILVTIAIDTPRHRHFNSRFWFVLTISAFSVFVMFGWFTLIEPFIKWLKTGEIDFPQNLGKQEVQKLKNTLQTEIIDDSNDGLFSKETKFYDVNGVPVTFNLNSLGLPTCNAWDVFPPQEISYEEVRNNGKLISRSLFDDLIEKYLPDRT